MSLALRYKIEILRNRMLLEDKSLNLSPALPAFSTLAAVQKTLVALGAALFVCFAIAGSAFAQQGPITAKALIGNSVSDPDAVRYSDVAEAIKRFENRDQLSARTFLERAVQKDNKLPPVGVMMAKLQLLSGNAAAIRPALEQAVVEDSADDPEPYLLLAEEALVNNRTIEAEALFDKTAAMIENYAKNAKRKRRFIIRTNRGLAIIAERRQRWEKAISFLNTWLEQDPEDTSALSRKGQILFMLDKEAEGYQSFVEAKKLNDKLQSPYVSAALMYSRKGKDREAMQAFEKAFSEESGDERTMIAYSQALIKAGDIKKARDILKKSRAQQEESVNLWLLTGVTDRMAGDAASGEQSLMKALALNPSNRDVLNQLAQMLIESGDRNDQKRALSFASMNGQLNPDNPDVNITLAWTLYKNGQGAQANAALQKAIRGGALSGDGQYLLAQMLLLNKDKANAKKLLNAALADETGIFVQRDAAKELLSTL